jgi:hypothetical protein
MSNDLNSEWRGDLQQMTPEEKRAFLRVFLRLRVHCPRCPVKNPQMDREPCRACTILPGDRGRPTTTVN